MKKIWTTLEIRKLKEMLERYEGTSWDNVAKHFPGRSKSSVKYAVKYYLPDVKSPMMGPRSYFRTHLPPKGWQMRLGAALETARKERGRALRDVSRASGISVTAYRNWRMGRYTPQLDSLVCWCKELGINASDVMKEAGL